MKALVQQAEKALGAGFTDFLRRLGVMSGEHSGGAWIVGGFVRDLLLGSPSPDLDFTVVGDAPALMKRLRAEWPSVFPLLPAPSGLTVFRRYGTGKLSFRSPLFPGVDHLDFATARSETYPQPGGRPEVRPGSLEEDLRRRDFSINALAINITPALFGELVDLFNGKDDVGRGIIRILHERSFLEDPVRLIRAVRFISRFGFHLDKGTEDLFTDAVQQKYLLTVPPMRVFDELRKALSEDCGSEIALRLADLTLLEQIHPELKPDRIRQEAALYRDTPDYPAPGGRFLLPWERRFLQLAAEATAEELSEMLAEFSAAPDTASRLLEAKKGGRIG